MHIHLHWFFVPGKVWSCVQPDGPGIPAHDYEKQRYKQSK